MLCNTVGNKNQEVIANATLIQSCCKKSKISDNNVDAILSKNIVYAHLRRNKIWSVLVNPCK